MICTEFGGVDWLYPRVTIETLPDDILLKTFEFYLGKDDDDEIDFGYNYDGWQTLVHVCCRWRFIVFASPRRLNLKLYCTERRLANSKALDIWPTLPLVVFSPDLQSNEDVTNVIAALKHHSRVCKIDFCSAKFQDSLLEAFAAIDEPFLALTSLHLASFAQNVPVLADSFLGGSAPQLQALSFAGIPYPSIGILLSSTTNLVSLSLRYIPRSGYVSPETIAPCLSTSPGLESLEIGFRHPQSEAHRASRHPPPLARVVFPNLTHLRFRGDIEYLEGVLSRIETPMLHYSNFQLFNQLAYNTPLLGHFIRRTETFMTISGAHVRFWNRGLIIEGQEMTHKTTRVDLDLRIRCKALDWQLSAAAHVSNLFLSSLPALETFEIVVSHEDYQSEIEVIQWREFLQPFTYVKKMTLESKDPVRIIAPVLQEFARETSMLPALQDLFLRAYSPRPSGPPKEAIEQFIATRQSYGQSIAVHYG